MASNSSPTLREEAAPKVSVIGKLAKRAAVALGAIAGSAGTDSEQGDTSNWVPIQTSDGQKLIIHPEELEEAQRRDLVLQALPKKIREN